MAIMLQQTFDTTFQILLFNVCKFIRFLINKDLIKTIGFYFVLNYKSLKQVQILFFPMINNILIV